MGGELDVALGEWVPDFPDRKIHGYRISQLFSSKVDPGEVLDEYRTTRFADRFYNLKIGVAWADLERRLDIGTVLALCGEAPMVERSDRGCIMGVDTGKQLHVSILRNEGEKRHLIHLTVVNDFGDLDALMERFRIRRCVIDGLPETHATRDFANRHPGRVFLCFFNEHQRGKPNWNRESHIVQVNRTEALDASRSAIRDAQVVLPRQQPIVEEFAQHLSADAKVLEENEETGAKRYKYVRTGPDHFSLAFTYALLATAAAKKRAGVWGRR